MGLRSKIGNMFLKLFSPEGWGQVTTTSDAGWSGSGGGAHISKYNKNALMAQNKELIYTCLDLRAMVAVKTPLHVYAIKNKGGRLLPKSKAVSSETQKNLQRKAHLTKWVGKDMEIEEIVDDNNPLFKLMNDFNPRDTRASVITLLMEHLDLVGNAYFNIEWDKALRIPKYIWPMYPQCMTIITGKGKDKDKVIGYEYRVGAVPDKYKPGEILHIKTPNPSDLVYGSGIIERLIDSITLDKNMTEHASAIFRNMGTPSMVITPKGDFIKGEQRKRVEADIKEQIQGVRKSGKALFLSTPLNIDVLSKSLSELSYIEGRGKIEEKVAAAFHVPLSFIKTENVNKSNAEVGEIMLPRYAVEPRLTLIEEWINKYLAPLFDEALFVSYDSPVPDDRKQDREDMKIRVSLGVSTVNEERIADGRLPYDDVPDGWGGTLPALQSPAMAFGDSGDAGEGEPKGVKKKSLTPEERETHWKKFDQKLLPWEAKIIRKCRELFNEMYQEVFDNIGSSDYTPNEFEESKVNDPDNLINTWMFGEKVWKERFNGELLPLSKAIYIEGGDDTLNDLVAGISIDIENPRAEAWMGQKEIKIKEIVETDKNKLRKSLTEGIKAGETIADIKKRVEKELGIAKGSRSTVIARTESSGAYNGGSFEGARQSNVAKTKDWLATMDDRVREEHEVMNGESVLMDQSFSNGLMYPGDPSGSAEQIMQCRCTIIYGV